MNEIWKEIEGTKGKYLISNLGNVYSVTRGKQLRPKVDKYGYKCVCLFINPKRMNITIHRLVAQAFIPNPDNFVVVNHKDLNKLNNEVNNLEWCTVKDNVNHWYKNDKTAATKLKEYQKHSCEANSHIIKVYKDDKFIGQFNSKQECAKALNISEKTIYNSIRNRYGNRKGYVFELMENPKYKNNVYKNKILAERG